MRDIVHPTVRSYHGAFEILGLAALGAAASEFISWLLIYRKHEYQRLSASIEKASKRLEKEKEVPAKGGKNKNLARIEKELAHENRDMAVLRMKSSLAAGLAHAIVFSYVYNKYDGQPVARLPFEPFSFIRQISHRNLPGNDYCECSVFFFYMLCSLCLRPNLQRALGFAPSNTPSLMNMQSQMLAKLSAS
mmetsp:Transcript_2492/g.4838  ORF Transcript_2492/g.4838 Transcript_2492/m.4838 type:complete len:191 (-) Transcript_2492:289-861(-)